MPEDLSGLQALRMMLIKYPITTVRENAERHIRQALSLAKNTLKSMDNHAQLL